MKAVLRAIKGWVATIFWGSLVMCLSVWMAKAAFADYPLFKILLFVMAFVFVVSLIAFQLEKSTGVAVLKSTGRIFIFLIALIGESIKLLQILIYAIMISILAAAPFALFFKFLLELQEQTFWYVSFFIITLLWYGFGNFFVRCSIRLILHNPDREKQRLAYRRISDLVFNSRNIKIIIYLFNFLFLVFYSIVELSGVDEFRFGFFTSLIEIKEVILYTFLSIVAFDALINLARRNTA